MRVKVHRLSAALGAALATALLLTLWLPPAHARVVVLIHGYLGGSLNWQGTVVEVLTRDGWRDGGDLGYDMPPPSSPAGDVVYTMRLPSETRLPVQAAALRGHLDALRRHHPNAPLVLVGHSVGGVVARLAMVLEPALGVQALITIASPHLGSDVAELALLASNSPLAALASELGIDTLNQSRALYEDLLPERPGTFLYWLNRQPHPPAVYISVVREQDRLPDGDLLVSARSQDLRAVTALGDRAVTFRVPGGHELTPEDGRRLLAILNNLP